MLSVVLAGLVLPEACEQPRIDPAPIDMSRDTTATRLVMASVFGALSYAIAGAVLDPSQKAWRIELPAEDAGWPQFRDHFLMAVRGHHSTSAPESRATLSIHDVQLREDTLVASFT